MSISRPRASFFLKAVVAVALVASADVFFFGHLPGSLLGVFALLWLAAVAILRSGWMADRRGMIAAGCAFLLALVLADRPSFIAWILFGLAMMVAVLSARVRAGESAWNWIQRLIVHAVLAVAGPAIDAVKMGRIQQRRGRALDLLAVLKFGAVPVIGSLVFLLLFASANPLIAQILGAFRLPGFSNQTVAHGILWIATLIAVWGILRPRWHRKLLRMPTLKGRTVSDGKTGSVLLSLIVFNLLFAIQNGLDLLFLWSGAALPPGMTLAEYAHRGAYPLMVTALLAGLFVLVFLRGESGNARCPAVRALVMMWVGQNLFLVASCLLRMADYIEVYSLTRMRIVAMVWMVTVAIGLGLICWRVLRNRSATWLVNSNVAVALLVCAGFGIVDLGAIAANWNVRHAREVDGHGAALDLCYLDSLNGAAAVPLVRLEQSVSDAAFRQRIGVVRGRVIFKLEQQQADWLTWRWRDARRLQRITVIDDTAISLPIIDPFQSCADALNVYPVAASDEQPVKDLTTTSAAASPLTFEFGA